MKTSIMAALSGIILSITSFTIHAQQSFDLPENFPDINVNVHDDPEPGYIFITPSGLWGYFMDATPYLAIVDNYGTPVYYLELSQPAFDFKVQDNGNISFNGGGYGVSNHIMNKEYEIIDSKSISGYSGTDFHEFRLREDESCLLLGYDDRVVDMSVIVPGGQQNATVRGSLIQETDIGLR
jgi:hypothetical protein